MAAHSDTLLSRGLWFDERFDFHFYDLDFCREAERLGVRVGTWPLPVIHESGGGFGSPSWRRACEVYFDKWGS
jgi:GT2 family glycosyltransferase